MYKVLLFALMFFISLPSHAGLFEVSLSGNYRQNSLGKDSATGRDLFTRYTSITSSVAYYFWEQSALELSYTNGKSEEKQVSYNARTDIELYGLDFIFAFAPRKAIFAPYIKVGVTYQIKQTSYQQLNAAVIKYPPIEGLAPSAGLGFKYRISEHFGFKMGIEAWTSPLNDDQDTTTDFAGRAGISWVF